MPIKLIGRTNDFKGKPLWEILANLKNFGVGRLVIRNRFQRYPEPCYMRILKVAATPPATEPDTERKVIVLVEKVFRGIRAAEPSQLDGSTYKADYQLIPKDQEYRYVETTMPPPEKKILPRTMDFPPLFSQMLIRQMKAKGIAEPEKPKLTIDYNMTNMHIKNYRIAEEGETPMVELHYGLDKSSILYPETEATKPA